MLFQKNSTQHAENARDYNIKSLESTFSTSLSVMDVNRQDKNGWTPLHLTVLKKNATFLSLLLEHGADADIVTTKGWHPLHTLAKLSCHDVDRSFPKTKKAKGICHVL